MKSFTYIPAMEKTATPSCAVIYSIVKLLKNNYIGVFLLYNQNFFNYSILDVICVQKPREIIGDMI